MGNVIQELVTLKKNQYPDMLIQQFQKKQNPSAFMDKQRQSKKYQSISSETRQEVLRLLMVDKLSAKEVATRLNLKLGTCYAIKKLYKKSGRLTKKKTRKRRINIDVIVQITLKPHPLTDPLILRQSSSIYQEAEESVPDTQSVQAKVYSEYEGIIQAILNALHMGEPNQLKQKIFSILSSLRSQQKFKVSSSQQLNLVPDTLYQDVSQTQLLNQQRLDALNYLLLQNPLNLQLAIVQQHLMLQRRSELLSLLQHQMNQKQQ